MELKPGIYERLVDQKLKEALDKVESQHKKVKPIDVQEGPALLSKYLKDQLALELHQMQDSGRSITEQIEFTNQLLNNLNTNAAISPEALQLLSVISENSPHLPDSTKSLDITRPLTSLSNSSLFTGAAEEPKLYEELKREIASADRVDMLVAFIKWGGFSLLADSLKNFTARGGKLRIITTTYMGYTDYKVIEILTQLPNTSIKISYDTRGTRLHAKSYIFHRDSGFSTAYIGSSNLTSTALMSGLEWNLKITAQDLPDTLNTVNARFEGYWNSKNFELYTDDTSKKLSEALKHEKGKDAPNYQVMFDLHPYVFQQEILDQLEAERQVKGHFKNLVVAATGTGKTVISAFDYKRCSLNGKQYPKLLFIAHREEILKQSLGTFQIVLKDPNFGELWVGEHEPEEFTHLFVSIQTAHSKSFNEIFAPDYFDFIIIDEFHHAAADTYQKILNHFNPEILLGLTATPERMDGKDILSHFDQRIAAEIRLPEAINRNLLCPFQYYGVSDTVDLESLSWSKGGYKISELTSAYASNRQIADQRAGHIIQTLDHYVADVDDVIGLGFCASIEHAKYMAEFFTAHGIPSLSLDATTGHDIRKSAKKRLVSGEVKFIFVVDLYNEGVDIPEINTIMFLRPTESLTIFLQQLGRGLRISEGKEYLTVLDFIGLANRNYNFTDKFQALLMSEKDVLTELEHGFPSAPNGCYIYLEKKPQKAILENIKGSLKNTRGLTQKVKDFYEDTGYDLTLANFLSYYHLKPQDIYRFTTFSFLLQQVGHSGNYDASYEETIRKGFFRIGHIDSRRWIQFILNQLPKLSSLDYTKFDELGKRMFNMFYMTIWNKFYPSTPEHERQNDLQMLSGNSALLHELSDLLKFCFEKIDFVDEPVDLGFSSPLDLHCTYSRNQILAAMDIEDPSTVREGVKYLKDKNIDLLFVTLNKTEDDYSPTTFYNDYSISDYLFHWQSQSTTSEGSSTGQRYIHHAGNDHKILLFVRNHKTLKNETQPYTYLGLVDYQSHEGSLPMNIIWRLQRPIPAKYLRVTDKLTNG